MKMRFEVEESVIFNRQNIDFMLIFNDNGTIYQIRNTVPREYEKNFRRRVIDGMFYEMRKKIDAAIGEAKDE